MSNRTLTLGKKIRSSLFLSPNWMTIRLPWQQTCCQGTDGKQSLLLLGGRWRKPLICWKTELGSACSWDDKECLEIQLALYPNIAEWIPRIWYKPHWFLYDTDSLPILLWENILFLLNFQKLGLQKISEMCIMPNHFNSTYFLAGIWAYRVRVCGLWSQTARTQVPVPQTESSVFMHMLVSLCLSLLIKCK